MAHGAEFKPHKRLGPDELIQMGCLERTYDKPYCI